MPVENSLNEYIVELYKVLDNELADAYGIDPGTTPRMVGRHIEPKKIRRRLINPSNGVAASTLLPHTLRLVASKILTFGFPAGRTCRFNR